MGGVQRSRLGRLAAAIVGEVILPRLPLLPSTLSALLNTVVCDPLGTSLKSGLRILIRAPKVPFLVPRKWIKAPVLAILGVSKLADSETTFQYKLAPNTPKKDTIRNQNRPFCVNKEKIFLPNIFLEHGPFFQMQSPSSKSP